MPKRFFLRPYMWILVITWTVVVAASLFWNITESRNDIIQSARIQARVAFDKDIIYRRWNAGHGGVFVPVTEETGPNPYLKDVKERDIQTPSGKQLTLMNPAYMTRQAHELAEKEFGVRGHITSLNPIRPANAADPWETKALQSFEQGKTEVSSIEIIGGKDYMRLMKPLITEKGCLKCHESQGYKEGDIRGGISVSVPMKELWALSHSNAITLSTAHMLLWLIGIGGIVLGVNRIRQGDLSRLKAEELIRNAEQEWRLTFDSITDLVSVLDMNYKIVKANKALADFLETTPDKLVGKHCYEVVHSLDAPFPDCPHKEMIKTKQTVTREIFNTKYGLHLMITASPLFENNELKGSIHFIKDITERKLAEAELEKHRINLEELVKERTGELEEKNIQLQNALKELESFSYSISHDLKAPLRAISGFSNMLLEEYSDDLDKEGKRKLGVIHKNVAYMGQLINDILEFSRMSRQPLNKSRINMKNLAEKIFNELKPEYGKRVIHYKVNDLPTCSGDLLMVRLILTNLLSNAIKFTRIRETAHIEVGRKTVNNETVYYVKDNGVGYDMKYEDKLFGLFQRLHSPKEFEGTGVGLAIVQQLVHHHGGRVWAEGRVNEGAIFYFTL